MIEMQQEKEDLQLNMAPMIDMIFLLIIFFLTATTFTEREREQDALWALQAFGTRQKEDTGIDQQGHQ